MVVLKKTLFPMISLFHMVLRFTPFVAVAKKQANHMCGSYGIMKGEANPDENRVEVDFSGDFDM